MGENHSRHCSPHPTRGTLSLLHCWHLNEQTQKQLTINKTLQKLVFHSPLNCVSFGLFFRLLQPGYYNLLQAGGFNLLRMLGQEGCCHLPSPPSAGLPVAGLHFLSPKQEVQTSERVKEEAGARATDKKGTHFHPAAVASAGF